MHLNSINILKYASWPLGIGMLFLLLSCGTYQNTSIPQDGIYNQNLNRPTTAQQQRQNEKAGYYQNYFKEQGEQITMAQGVNQENEVFTDIDNYTTQSNYQNNGQEDIIYEDEEYTYNNASWGSNPTEVNITVIDRNPYLFSGFYHPWGIWSAPFHGAWYGGYYGAWGWGWHNPRFGWGSAYWGWGHPYNYWGAWNHPFYGGVAYHPAYHNYRHSIAYHDATRNYRNTRNSNYRRNAGDSYRRNASESYRRNSNSGINRSSNNSIRRSQSRTTIKNTRGINARGDSRYQSNRGVNRNSSATQNSRRSGYYNRSARPSTRSSNSINRRSTNSSNRTYSPSRSTRNSSATRSSSSSRSSSGTRSSRGSSSRRSPR